MHSLVSNAFIIVLYLSATWFHEFIVNIQYRLVFIQSQRLSPTIKPAPVVLPGIGVPIMLAYVYGVVPISLCRGGGCGVSRGKGRGVRIDFDEDDGPITGESSTSVLPRGSGAVRDVWYLCSGRRVASSQVSEPR